MRAGIFNDPAAHVPRLTGLGLVALLLLAPLSAPAMAVDADIVAAQTGAWLVAPEDGTPGCMVTLDAEPVIGGYGMRLADDCAEKLPAIADSAAWAFSDGGLVFIDALRKVLVSFAEQEGSPYRSTDLAALFLVKPTGGMDHVPSPQSLAGTWTMKRPSGEVLCRVTLDGTPLGDGMRGLSPAGDCPRPVKDLKLVRWQLDGFSLGLLGEEGSALMFDAEADGRFSKSPGQGGKPLLLLKD